MSITRDKKAAVISLCKETRHTLNTRACCMRKLKFRRDLGVRSGLYCTMSSRISRASLEILGKITRVALSIDRSIASESCLNHAERSGGNVYVCPSVSAKEFDKNRQYRIVFFCICRCTLSDIRRCVCVSYARNNKDTEHVRALLNPRRCSRRVPRG